MTEKTKKIILISIGCLLCVAVAVGIATRFSGNAAIPSGVVPDDPAQSGDPVDVNINSDDQNDMNIQAEIPDESKEDPAQGADSSGLEQSIQADPVKPEQPEKPEAPSGTTTLPEDHDGSDVPEEERKTEDEEPPTYEEPPANPPAESEPAAGSTNSSGQVYVPGFGYVENSGGNTGIQDNEMYENGNKIGEMGGGN
ncbi:hypothetical protein LJB68_01545 [bacterium 210820-DFI.6.52]|nr:hypothetical protein [bacterium 210820-DFI.6.52]